MPKAKTESVPQDPAVRYETDEERAAASNTTVGNIFRFGPLERSIISMVCDDYEKKSKAATKALDEIDLSPMHVSAARSECATVNDIIKKAKADSDITISYTHRKRLGSALSLHARKLEKKKKDLTEMLVDTNEVQDSIDLVKKIANRIGEQLTMFVEEDE
jgi:hypothetical protein